MSRFKITFLILFIASICYSKVYTPEKHPLFYAILKLKPKIDKAFAMKVSNLLHKHVRAAGLNPYRAIAIIMQESSFRNVNVMRRGVATDIGLLQIHKNTAQAYGFDVARLKSHDVEYAIQCYVVIMKDKIRICKRLKEEAWSCYHSSTEKYRQRYVRYVNRYYYEIVEVEDGY